MSIDLRLGELERLVRWLSSRSERALEAEFVDTASSPASSLRVTVPGYDDGEHTFGPVVWSPLGNALPAAGDRCLVAESDDGSWWVLAWWSSGQGTGLGSQTRNSGTTNVGWPGGSVNSNIITVTHGFASVPEVWVQSQNQAGVGANTAFVLDVGATTFRVQVFTPSFQPLNTATTPVAWEAWP